jgi:hypothetical protein
MFFPAIDHVFEGSPAPAGRKSPIRSLFVQARLSLPAKLLVGVFVALRQLGTWQGIALATSDRASQLVKEDGFNYCSLLQVSRREPLVNILIGVLASSLIAARVLNELKPGNTRLIEASVIG